MTHRAKKLNYYFILSFIIKVQFAAELMNLLVKLIF